jgi:hypothetical protein
MLTIRTNPKAPAIASQSARRGAKGKVFATLSVRILGCRPTPGRHAAPLSARLHGIVGARRRNHRLIRMMAPGARSTQGDVSLENSVYRRTCVARIMMDFGTPTVSIRGSRVDYELKLDWRSKGRSPGVIPFRILSTRRAARLPNTGAPSTASVGSRQPIEDERKRVRSEARWGETWQS